MEVRFKKKELDRLETDLNFDAGFAQEVVRKFRMRMQLIRAAEDEMDFYALKSLHLEKLKGKRSHQRSMKLNNKWRLILEIDKTERRNVVVIVDIKDYH